MCYTFLGSVTQVVIILLSESNEESASCDRYHILFFLFLDTFLDILCIAFSFILKNYI